MIGTRTKYLIVDILLACSFGTFFLGFVPFIREFSHPLAQHIVRAALHGLVFAFMMVPMSLLSFAMMAIGLTTGYIDDSPRGQTRLIAMMLSPYVMIYLAVFITAILRWWKYPKTQVWRFRTVPKWAEKRVFRVFAIMDDN